MLTENASIIQQKYLGAKGLIVLIAVMNMFVPLSIDLYLPALPTIGTEFAATPLMVNLTLVSFFFFFAVGILLFGPVSDKYGRRGPTQRWMSPDNNRRPPGAGWGPDENRVKSDSVP